MQFDCNGSSEYSPTFRQEALKNLNTVTPACVAICIFGTMGIANNIFLLIIARRIGWFKYPPFYLIINQSIVDLITSLALVVSAIRLLIAFSTHTPNVIQTFHCLLIEMTASVSASCIQRCALIVAFDRFFLVFAPMKWLTMKARYRYGLILFAWSWAIVQQTSWLFFADPTTCLSICISCINLPWNFWRGTLMAVADNLTSIVIVIFYIIIPGLTATFCKRVISNQGHVTVYWNDMLKEQKLMLIRVRIVSYWTLASYIFMLSSSFVDFFDFYTIDTNVSLLLSSIALAGMSLHTAVPVYLFAWKDPAFGRESKKLLLKCFPFCYWRKQLIIGNETNGDS